MSPVFDEAKYRALLEKLEVREIAFCSLYAKFRFDAEHYQRRFDDFFKIITKKEYSSLQDLLIGSVVTGHTPAMKNNDFYNGDVPFIKTDNLREFCINDNFSDMLTAQGKNELKNSALELNDIVVTIIGATEKIIGRAMLIKEEFVGSCINQNIARIRLKKSKISPEFLTAYLNSRYGRLGLLFNSRQTEQVNLNCREVEELLLPILSENVVNCVTNIVNQALHKLAWTKKIYINTEKLLLQELGLTDWQPDDESVATKTFANFQNSGRLDAEYYQPKYEAIAEKLLQYSNGTVSCENILVNAMTKLTNGTQYCYLELADIGKSGEINSCSLDVAENLPSRARQKVKTNDVIVSSVEGSLTSCALITEEYNNAICSTGFHVLRSAEINSETLLLLMKSSPIQALLKQGCSGTILTAILPDALKAIKLPLIRKEVQNELAAKVQESFALRKESKRLLDLAKHAVEVAIEQGEDAAMKLLISNI